MVTIELTQDEQDYLVDLLDTSIENLRTEIRETDRLPYKEMLRNNREVYTRILEKIRSEPIRV